MSVAPSGRRPRRLLRYRLWTHEILSDVALWEVETEDGSHSLLLTRPMLEQIAKEFGKVVKQLTQNKKGAARRAVN